MTPCGTSSSLSITYLGHAGFVLEAGGTRILVDPWFYPAFLGSWFPSPDNRFLLDETAAARYDAVFVSHVHEDHFDRTFLDTLERNTRVICADFRSRSLLGAWRSLGFTDITVLGHGERIGLAPAVDLTLLCDTSHREDSALLLDVDGFRFLDLNDCLVQFGELPDDVDLLTRQFSGAMWYPNCYRYSREVMAQKVATVRRNLFQTLLTTCDMTKPRWFVPSAGPPCFLDPQLQQFNRREETIFPVWTDVASEFARACPATEVLCVEPGDRIEIDERRPVVERREDERSPYSDLAAYAAARAAEYQQSRARSQLPVTEEELRDHLVRRQRTSRRLLEDCNKPVVLGTESRAWTFTLRASPDIELTRASPDAPAEYRLIIPEWVLRDIIDRDSWEEALLSMRVTLERDPDEYDVRLLGYLRYGHERAVINRLTSDIRSSEETIERDGYSLQRFCPHSGEDLTHAIIRDGIIECPRHHWKWDAATGRCVEGGTLPLRIEPAGNERPASEQVP